MRTVSGPTTRVVVVGAGLAGLSCALRLAGADREVTLVEREAVPGGRAGLLELDGYSFDTGPTVLTMPDLLGDAFASVGESMTDWLDLVPLDPVYRAHFADGSVLRVRSDVDAMEEEVRAVCGTAAVDGYRRFVAHVTRLYQVQMRDFIDRNLDSPRDLLVPNLARLVALGGFRSLSSLVRRSFDDERLRRVFSFQAMYAGVSPYEARALYAVISYMDSVAGVSFPRGGMHAVPRALAGAAEKHGVRLRLSTEVTRVETRGDRATAVVTTDGERLPADVVVLTADLPTAYRDLLPGAARPRLATRYSPSCFLLLAGSTLSVPGKAHHDIHFGGAWREVFRELRRGSLMTDPSFLVTTPSVTDPTLAPEGRSSYYTLFPVPNLEASLDWSVIGPRYLDEVIAVMEQRGYPGFGASLEVTRTTTPADWAALGHERGTPFAAAHTFRQTGPFRPPNLAPGLENVVFAGSGTTPGVGVPMVLISGRLAAERVLGRSPG